MICEKELSPNILIAIPNDEIKFAEKCLGFYSDVKYLGGFAYISAQK
jgi:hypothetical protein